MPNSLAVDVADLRFSYGDSEALSINRCQLQRGQTMAVLGPSGCGKTTFLHLLAGLIRPSVGSIRVLDQDLSALSGAQLDRFRGQHLGMVFQRFHLLPALTVLENIALAQRLARVPVNTAAIGILLGQLGINEIASQRPSTLSQGQAQRVAIARALVHNPGLVIADEPTSALDNQNAESAIRLLRESAAAIGAALIVVTHDERIRGSLERELELAPAL